MTWWDQAACRGMDPELFHPHKSDGAELALGVCGRCSVREACRDHAFASGEPLGVWGGVPEWERRAERRRLRREGVRRVS